MLNAAFAKSLADDFIAGFNTRKLDVVLAHYRDDVEMVSPLAVKVLGETSGVVRGKTALHAYWTKALSTVPDLQLELVAVLAGMQCITIVFRGLGGKLAGDTLFIDENGLVHRTVAQYLAE